MESLRRLTDEANRASVVIYTMDARGLQTLTANAGESMSDYSPDQLERILYERREDFFDTQRDLLNNLLGTLVALSIIAIVRVASTRRAGRGFPVVLPPPVQEQHQSA